ncbi:MAG TPA: gamma-glutamyltransferase [Thermomicrobiales bacterium]|nr:gamma-glutamyltransferase [Thermomicrobiales bacterium]
MSPFDQQVIRSTRRRVVGGALAASLAGPASHLASPTVNARQDATAHVQAVASAHQAATDAGIGVLQDGGSAADAAIAVAGVLTVVEGWFSSVLGGGTWGLYYDASTGEVTSLDGVGPTGSLATREDYAGRAGESGIHQSNVPGAWDGWMTWLLEYGRLDLGRLLQPAIDLARNGHEASAELESWASRLEDEIMEFPDSKAVYAPNGKLPVEGDTIVMEHLAATFDALVTAYDDALGESREAAIQAARDYYYRGPIAEALVTFSDENDGYLTLEDFNGFAAGIVTPLSITYRDDIVVYENPPNSQGITMLLALNILKGMGLEGRNVDNPDAVHTQIEAMKLAFADRYTHIGDPARVEMPIDELLSEDYAAQQRDRIDLTRAMAWPITSGMSANAPAHTTTFQVVDRDGNAAAVTTSLGAHFLVAGDTGIHMNNRMRMLSVEPGNPNELTPAYKVRHTSCPYMVLRGGRPWFLGGNTGADTQPQGQVQQFLSVVEFGLGAQDAISRPRWLTTAFPSGTYEWEIGNQLRTQEGFYGPLISALKNRGHDVVEGEGTFGSASMVILSDDGTDADFGVEPSFELAAGTVIPARS